MAALYLLSGVFAGIAGTAIAMGGPNGFGALFFASFVLAVSAAIAEYNQ
jgi:hypothetical protein